MFQEDPSLFKGNLFDSIRSKSYIKCKCMENYIFIGKYERGT